MKGSKSRPLFVLSQEDKMITTANEWTGSLALVAFMTFAVWLGLSVL